MRDAIADFTALDTVPMGINFADAESHQAFIDAYDFPFDLLVDPGNGTAKAWGAMKDEERIRRTVFLVGKDGRVLHREHGSPEPAELFPHLREAKDG